MCVRVGGTGIKMREPAVCVCVSGVELLGSMSPKYLRYSVYLVYFDGRCIKKKVGRLWVSSLLKPSPSSRKQFVSFRAVCWRCWGSRYFLRKIPGKKKDRSIETLGVDRSLRRETRRNSLAPVHRGLGRLRFTTWRGGHLSMSVTRVYLHKT